MTRVTFPPHEIFRNAIARVASSSYPEQTLRPSLFSEGNPCRTANEDIVDAIAFTDHILDIFLATGDESYFGEPVSQLEHGLQTASLAVRGGAPDTLVVAALLHDIGHLIHGAPEHVADLVVDARHEDAGEQWLRGGFGPSVTEPIRLHVAAKRYLCGTDRDYARSLSPASQVSLALQGGPMSRKEIAEFFRSPWWQEAVALRRWDDAAKKPGLKVPDLPSYRSRIERVALAGVLWS